MFTKKIIDSDAFLDMPLSAQSLYFHLNMRADDDGFLNNPKKIQRMIGASDDDLKLLLAKRFILSFENGVIVIKHWRMHNWIRKDRYSPTQYLKQLNMLAIQDDGSYTEKPLEIPISTECQPIVIPNDNQVSYQAQPQVSIGKESIVKYSDSVCVNNEDRACAKHTHGKYNNVFLTDDEFKQLQEQFPNDYEALIEKLSKGIATYGYKYNSHYLAILQWVENEKSSNKQSARSFNVDEFFEAAVIKGFEEKQANPPKTAADDETIRERAEALKKQFT